MSWLLWCAAHLEMLGLLRREWDRAREGSPQGRAAGQPENLTSVRRVAREVLAQVCPCTSILMIGMKKVSTPPPSMLVDHFTLQQKYGITHSSGSNPCARLLI